MEIRNLLYREEQSSLLNEEQSEVRTLFKIVHNGKKGHLRIDSYFNQRDADETFFCDVPGITCEYIANTDWCHKLQEEMWQKPDHVAETRDIRKIIISLASHQLT